MQIPSNMILSKTRPSIYLPGWMAVWGVLSGCTAAVQNFSDIAACRFLLGCAEAPYWAGAAFLVCSSSFSSFNLCGVVNLYT